MLDFMNGLFDFNGDGRTDLTEQVIGFQIIEQMERDGIHGLELSQLFAEDDEDNEDF